MLAKYGKSDRSDFSLPLVERSPSFESALMKSVHAMTGSAADPKAFQPHILAVSIGSTVSFPNEDAIFHNVFSMSAPQPFDLGLYRSGETRTRTFSSAGTYRVFCNIHPQMSALVVVVSTPHITTAGADGRFTLTLPPGRYRVTALSERAGPVSVEVTSAAGAVTAPDLTLDESAWNIVQHKNKFGQEYPAAAYTK